MDTTEQGHCLFSRALLMPWLLLQSHELLSVFQLNLQAAKSFLCCHLANTLPGTGQTSSGSWTIQRWKRQSCHILLCHICPNTFRFISNAASPVFFQKLFEAHPDLFSNYKWTQSFLNPDTASISSLWTTHLRTCAEI